MTRITKTVNSDDWLAGYHQALEDAAKMVETHIVWPQLTPSVQPLSRKGRHRKYAKQPRHHYADAIRAMKDKRL